MRSRKQNCSSYGPGLGSASKVLQKSSGIHSNFSNSPHQFWREWLQDVEDHRCQIELPDTTSAAPSPSAPGPVDLSFCSGTAVLLLLLL